MVYNLFLRLFRGWNSESLGGSLWKKRFWPCFSFCWVFAPGLRRKRKPVLLPFRRKPPLKRKLRLQGNPGQEESERVVDFLDSYLFYHLQDFSFSEGDALIAVRDSVSAFARSRGYLKVRVYPGDDSISYSEDGRTTYFRRFYILYEKSGF